MRFRWLKLICSCVAGSRPRVMRLLLKRINLPQPGSKVAQKQLLTHNPDSMTQPTCFGQRAAVRKIRSVAITSIDTINLKNGGGPMKSVNTAITA